MKVLLLNQTFYPDVVATAQQLSTLALAIKKSGHQVTVLTSRRAYDSPEKLFPKTDNWQGIQIHRILGTGFGKGAKWKRALDFATFIMVCCVRMVFLPKQQAIIALTSPPLISVIGAIMARIWGARFIYWVMDFNPDEAIAAGWLKQNSFAAWVLERLSRFSLRSAYKVVALDRFMRDRILAKGIPEERVVVIPPWSHDDHVRFNLEGREQFRREHGLDGKFVVMYSGNHSPCHPLDTLLNAALRLNEASASRPERGQSPQIHFAFIGGGSEFKRVQNFARDHQLKNVLCLPYQPLDGLSASLSSADLQVVVMGDPFVGLVHPCKIYNLLRLGLPVLYIGPPVSHITDLYEPPHPNGLPPLYRFAHGDVDGLVALLKRLASQPPKNLPASSDGMAGAPFASQASCLERFLALLH